MKESLGSFIGYWLPKLEEEMQDVLRFSPSNPVDASVEEHYGMMHYHMGWVNANLHADNLPKGKRLRPIFALLACDAVGGSPENALPAAAAIEILHNFSLVHDDIEDGDETRHHRTTVWKLWGVPLAINAGDAMFALSFAAMNRLNNRGVSAESTLRAIDLFTRTCVILTEGQHMDMQFENQNNVQPGDYFRMIEGKTAALLGCATGIGALIGNGSDEQVSAFERFGQCVGLSFQIQDDILGIWGEPDITGKPVGSDILRQKKSLPLLHALTHEKIGPKLSTLMAGGVSENQMPRVMDLLADAGSQEFASQQQHFYYESAVKALQEGINGSVDDSPLAALAVSLLDRVA